MVGTKATSPESEEVNDSSEAIEVSVTMPTSLVHDEDVDEELLQPNVEGRATYVSVQQDRKQVVVPTAGTSNIARLLADTTTRKTDDRSRTIRMVVKRVDGSEQQQDWELTAGGDSKVIIQDTLQMISNHSVGDAGNVDGDQQHPEQQIHQTLTIVPSETIQGEVSYQLIISQPDDIKLPGDSDDENNKNESATTRTVGATTSVELTKLMPKSIRAAKSASRKSQSMTQAHMCNYCNYTTPKRYLLVRHMKTHSEEHPHKCNVCERSFKTLVLLENHMDTHTGTKSHQCRECESVFTTSAELVRHVRYEHADDKPYRCTDCEYACDAPSKLKLHVRCHTGERPFQCPHCTYASSDMYKLKRHLRIHSGEKPYECEVCRARFTQSNSLKAHKLIHTGDKPVFQCELCPTTCGRKRDLLIHVQKLHTSDKPVKCRRCGKSFPDRYTYKMHAKTHDGEKCYKCDFCPYASNDQRYLESHMFIHTDQKPYECDECAQTFRQKQLLKRHKNFYHNPDYVPQRPKGKSHECSECGRAFKNKGNLVRHMATHDPNATAEEKEASRLMHGRFKKKRNNEDEVEEEYSEEQDVEDFDDEDEDDEDNDAGFDSMDPNEINVRRKLTGMSVIHLQNPEGEQPVAILSDEGLGMLDESVNEGSTIMGTTEDINDTNLMANGAPSWIQEVGGCVDFVTDRIQEDSTAVPANSRGRGRRKKTNDNDAGCKASLNKRSKLDRRKSRPRKIQRRIPQAAEKNVHINQIAHSSNVVEEPETTLHSEDDITRQFIRKISSICNDDED